MSDTLVFRYRGSEQVVERSPWDCITYCEKCTRKVHIDDIEIHEEAHESTS